MTGVVKRMRALKNKLYALKFGPGGAVLPANITRIHMEFGLKNGQGHVGPTKFWRDNLPRLKFWNPSVPMIVNRTSEADKPATMSIYLRQSAAGSSKKKGGGSNKPAATTTATTKPSATEATTTPDTAEAKQAASRSAWDGTAQPPPPVDGERVVTIDMTHMHSTAILAELVTKTGAVAAKPNLDEAEDMAALADVKKQGEADRKLVLEYVQGQKRQKALLERARREADAIKAANAM
ncbi:hypothetical protein MAPG_10836 [Magnaporthiopsis poae ATCC 64411]|uniref:Ribosomal protein/NADH dehydrogenase domain-containing protein n=1 Tax=Magnaporthiopsis poae (strain ATCC 64411 / 73-15) TaxID=644358 RepID=A0A0C4EDN1_MAGP6|nr:hypothetical protein MAPG_10836 [Magnaporthiopsis poae ATCC 64411]